MTTTGKITVAVAAPVVLALSFWAGTVTAKRDAPPVPDSPSADRSRVERLRAELEESRGSAAAARERVRRLEAEVERLGKALAASGESAREATRPVAPAPGAESPAAREDDPRDRIEAGLRTDPGSADHLSALLRLADWLVASADRGDEEAVRWGTESFDRAVRSEEIVAAEAEALADRFRRLAPGHDARPGIAIGVAGGWAGDDRLSDFLRSLRATAEPRLHGRLVRILDHHPSAAFGDYAVRVVRETDDSGVLAAFLDEDRVDAVAASGRAREYAAALADRIRAGPDLGERDELILGLALLAVRDPDAALAPLERVAADERDPDTAASLKEVVDLVRKGRATVKKVEDLLD